ncbi:MAG: hypothetical protein KJP23_07760 [Deltaproteobacteria bacterium]|nr:hypothetical protein [Deltaproteobacteria bacterium]
MEGIEKHRWPDPEEPGRYRGLKKKAKALHKDTNYAVVLQVNCAFFLRCAELRGWEIFYMDLAANPEFAVALMEKYLDIRLRMAEKALEEVGENIDIVMVSSDDLGMNDRTLVSPDMYCRLIEPLQKKTFAFFKAKTPAKRFYHCDGVIYPLMEDLIDIGVETLNPIQVSAVGMGDTKRLKSDSETASPFGGQLTPGMCFHLDLPVTCGRKSGGDFSIWGPEADTWSVPFITSSRKCPLKTWWPCLTRRMRSVDIPYRDPI